MNKIILYVCFLLIVVSCGDSAYVKQLKSDLTGVELSIENEIKMRKFYQDKIDSMFMSPNPSDPDVLEYLQLNKEKQDRVIDDLKKQKKDIELEILKNK